MKVPNLAIVTVLSLSLSAAGAGTNAATLTVTVKGATSDEGQMIVRVFENPQDFPKENAVTIAAGVAKIKAGSATFTFKDIPPGKYAVAGAHDENSNRKLDRNFLKIPTENFGFSNNAPASFGAPSFEEAAFEVVEPATSIEFTLQD